MSLKEFEEYIKTIDCENDSEVLYNSNDVDDFILLNSNRSISTFSDAVEQTIIQKHYYADHRYFYLKSNTMTIGNDVRYGRAIYGGTGNDINVELYPYYSVTGRIITSISSDGKTATSKYKCIKYVSKYVCEATTYTITIKYHI